MSSEILFFVWCVFLYFVVYNMCSCIFASHSWVRAHFGTSREAILGLNLNPNPKPKARTSRSYTRSWAARRTWSATRKTHKFSESRLKHKLSERSTPSNFCTENHSFRACYWEYCACNSGSCFMTLSSHTHTHKYTHTYTYIYLHSSLQIGFEVLPYERISPILLFYYT